VTSFCDYPEDAKKIRRIGDTFNAEYRKHHRAEPQIVLFRPLRKWKILRARSTRKASLICDESEQSRRYLQKHLSDRRDFPPRRNGVSIVDE
jgi:hypothetical protein